MSSEADPRMESLFESSLSPDPQTRLSAETQLSNLKQSGGFVAALFSLVLSSTKLPVRQAAAIYLKNHVKIHYPQQTYFQNASSNDPLRISEADRSFLKHHLLGGLASVPSSIKTLLIPTLAVVINTEYPEQWPDLLDQVVNLISSNQSSNIESGLIALLELLRLYRWTGSQKSQCSAQIVSRSFPLLLQHAQTMLSPDGYTKYSFSAGPVSAAEADSNIGHLLYLILKIYKTSITAELPIFQQQSIIPWTQVILAVARHSLISSQGFPSSLEDRERWSWTKAKKWSYFILNRLHSRYGSPAQLPQSMLQYKPFAEKFIAFFARSILQLYLEQVENFVGGKDWMSRKMICHTIIFFEESIRPKETWTILKEHIPTLLSKLIFPSMCISIEHLEDFEHQPDQFIKSELGEFFEDFTSNQSLISSSFILALATGRKKSMFLNLLSFITEVCSKYQAEGDPREKDGALRAFSCLASLLVETNSLRSKIEEFFLTFVFPEFQSPHAFLRARACEVVRKFESVGIDWSNTQLLDLAYRGTIQCFTDQSLPVRVQAALTLPEIFDHPLVHEALTPIISDVMQGLLRLSNEVDLDSLTQSVRRLVSEFSNELLPYSEDMARALNQSYMRLMAEIADLRERLGDDDEDSSEEKVLVAMSILKTLQQLVVGLEGKPAVLYQVQVSSLPLIVYTLKECIVEIYDEALELLDSIQFAMKEIPNEQWTIFEIIYEIFKTSGCDFITEMFPVLDNFVSYGSDYFLSRGEEFNKLLDIYVTSITSPQLGSSDRVISCKLADSILLCLKPRVDQAIPMFLEQTMKILQRGITTVEPVTTKALFMHSLEVVLNSIYQNPRLTMNLLIQNNWSKDFFSEWFSRLNSFKRTHDKKLGLLAICSMLSIGLEDSGESLLVQSSGQLLIGALKLFEKLPQSIRRRYELENEYSHESDDSFDGDSTTIDRSSEGGFNDENDEDDVIDEPERFFKGYNSRRRDDGEKTGFDGDIPESSLWSDEILWETPLDGVDVYKEFAKVMKNVEFSGNSALLNIINNSLSAENRSALEKILKQAQDEVEIIGSGLNNGDAHNNSNGDKSLGGGGGEFGIRNQIKQSIQSSFS